MVIISRNEILISELSGILSLKYNFIFYKNETSFLDRSLTKNYNEFNFKLIYW